MDRSKRVRHLAAGCFALVFTVFCAGAQCQQSNQNAGSGSPAANTQNKPDGKQPDQQSGKSGAPAKKNGSADSNPFPMTQSEAAANAASPGDAGQNHDSTPQKAGTGQKCSTGPGQNKPSPSKDNPFPEAQSKAAEKADAPGDGSENSGSSPTDSSSSAADYSSSDADLPPPDLGDGKLGLNRKMDSFTRDQTQDGRVEDDLKVADLYMKDGNYRGASLRYQDALKYDPQNDAALYGTADALCRQNLTADAMAHFKSYAKNNPQGKYALKAEKMLGHPNKCMHNW